MTEQNQKQLGSTLWGIADLQKIAEEQAIAAAKEPHNAFLRELGLKPLP